MKGAKRIRLDRLLVHRGLGGRRDIQKLIRRGAVSLDGVTLKDPSLRVREDTTLEVSGQVNAPLPLLVAYHKPVGQLSTFRDPWGREGLEYALPAPWRDGLHPVGRLDADTSGLLLFSSNGELTQRLLHPKHEIPRSYRAHVLTLPDTLHTTLSEGVDTQLGTFTARLDKVSILSEHDRRPEGAHEAAAIVEVTVTEGKHRMVRRMLHNAGASVLALHRLSYGHIRLGDLPVRASRMIKEEEQKLLFNR